MGEQTKRALIILIFAMYPGCSSSKPATDAMPLVLPDAWEGPPGCESGLVFADITSLSPDLQDNVYGGEAGWDHVDKYGPGVALGDLNGDGNLDLIQVRSERNQPLLRPPAMYQGNGDGTFTEVGKLVWNAVDNGTFALLFDHDSDDDLDLLIGVAGGDMALYRNDGDFLFTLATEQAGLVGIADFAFAASAGDVDGDGDLDLYVGQWRADLVEHGAGLAPNLLLLNNDGVFTDSGEDLRCSGSATLGTGMADLDGDNDLDIYVANDFFTDCLYENLGAQGWREVGQGAGIADGAMHAMGVSFGDLNGDGRIDIMVTDTEQPDSSRGNAVYVRNESGLRYSSQALELGLDGVSTLQADWLVCWGAAIEDFDLDGYADVHIATHTERQEIFLHNQAWNFVPNWDLINSFGEVDARGTAYGDIDGDGDLDIVVGRRSDSVQILRNDRDLRNQGLRVQVTPSRLAVGATIRVQVGDNSQVRVIQAGSGYMSSSPSEAIFGLCGHTNATSVDIQFPDGRSYHAQNVEAGTLVVTEAEL